jgi:hypothetical protein
VTQVRIQRNQQIRFEDSSRVIRNTAWRVMRRVKAGGAHTIQIEDVVSELSVVWCIARDRYNPELGIPFNAYLQNGMFKHINRWLSKEIPACHYVQLDKSGDDGETLNDVIADESIVHGDQLLDESEFAKQLIGSMSDRARQFIVLLKEPPLELVEEMRAIEKRAMFARKRGIATVASRHITASLIFRFMGAQNVERTQIMKEIRASIELLHERNSVTYD